MPLVEEDVDVLLEEDEQTDFEKRLYVFNDDVNTFEHVIECLMRICKHTLEQAEQCAHIVHYNGKCAVKDGSFKELKPYQEALVDEKIDARIL